MYVYVATPTVFVVTGLPILTPFFVNWIGMPESGWLNWAVMVTVSPTLPLVLSKAIVPVIAAFTRKWTVLNWIT